MKLPTFQPATVALSDIAPEGPNDFDEDYTARIELVPTYVAIGDKPPVWTLLEGDDLDGDPFFGRMVTDTHWKGVKREIDRVAETHDTTRPARIYHVIWEIGKTELFTMHNVVKLISLEKKSQGRLKHVAPELFRAQAEATRGATEH